MQSWREEVSVGYDKETQRPVQYSVAHECDGRYVGEVAHLLLLWTVFFFIPYLAWWPGFMVMSDKQLFNWSAIDFSCRCKYHSENLINAHLQRCQHWKNWTRGFFRVLSKGSITKHTWIGHDFYLKTDKLDCLYLFWCYAYPRIAHINLIKMFIV